MATESDNTTHEPSDEAKDWYAKHVAQSWTDQQASSDAFDTNLLTFSSAALGLSLAFIKDIVPLENAVWLAALYSSWGAFAGCILVTVASFQIAAQAQVAHQKTLVDYYLLGDESALKRKSRWSRALSVCTVIGSAFLLLGIVSTLLFASENVSHYKESKAWQMTQREKK